MAGRMRTNAIKEMLQHLDNDYEEEVCRALDWATTYKVSEGSTQSTMSCYTIASLVYLFEGVKKIPKYIGNMLCSLNAPYNDAEARQLLLNYNFKAIIYKIVEEWAHNGDVPPLFNVPLLNEKYKVLHSAAFHNSLNLVKWLLDSSVNVDIKDVLDRTALHVAVSYGHHEVAQELMFRNASLSAVDSEGQTPFEKALVLENFKIADFLEPNILCNQKMNRGETIFFKMIKENKESQVKYLLKYADFSVLNEAHQSALHVAASTGNPKITEILLKHLPDRDILNSLDAYQHSPLHLAVMGNKSDVVDLLLYYGAEITPAILLQVKKDNFSGIIGLFYSPSSHPPGNH